MWETEQITREIAPQNLSEYDSEVPQSLVLHLDLDAPPLCYQKVLNPNQTPNAKQVFASG